MTAYPLPAPDTDPQEGLGGFGAAGFDEAPGDVVLDAGMVAAVAGGTVILRSMEVTDEGVTVESEFILTLLTMPVGYDVRPFAQETSSGMRLGCLVSWWDESGAVRAALVSVTRRMDGSYVNVSIRHRQCPVPDGADIFPAGIHADFDPEWNVMVAVVTYDNVPGEVRGASSAAYRWRATFSSNLQTQDDIPEPGSGHLDLIKRATHPWLYSTGCIRLDTNDFLITLCDLGNILPPFEGQVFEAETSAILVRAQGYGLAQTIIQDRHVGRGFVEHGEDGWLAYLPVATHESDLSSDVQLATYDGSLTVIDLAVARIEGTANWRPTGLFCERISEPQTVDPFAFSADGFTFEDFLMALLNGTNLLLPESAVISDKIVVSVSLPDQPLAAANPRAFPSYLIMVDLQGQLTPTTTGPAVLGPKYRLGYGDVLRIATHPEGLVWAILREPDETATRPEGWPEGGGVEA